MVVKEFRSVKDGDQVYVEYLKDGERVSVQKTDKPIEYISEVLARIAEEPHVIFSVSAQVVSADVPSDN